MKPQKNRAGNRVYSNKDIKFILFIKSLLREKKYTIEGAKKILNELEEKDLDALELDNINDSKSKKLKSDIEDTKTTITVKPLDQNLSKNTLKYDLIEIKNILEILLSKLNK